MAKEKGRPNPPTAMGNHWGAGVQRRRHALGMTQERFAEALGVNVRTLQGWESGRRMAQFPRFVEDAIARVEREQQVAA